MAKAKKAPAKTTARKVAAKAKRRSPPIDLVRLRPEYFHGGRTPALVRLGPAKYLAAEGRGEPGGPAFRAAVAALFGVAWTLRYALKAVGGPEFRLPPLEGLWWIEAKARPTSLRRSASIEPKHWCWKLLLMVPDAVRKPDVAKVARAMAAKGEANAELVTLETLREGLCVQAMHVGPYDAQPETIAKMYVASGNHGYEPSGRHHEIYLSDPRRTKRAKLRTLLRQPVERSKGCCCGCGD
jgi:hypothetical protein